MFSVTTSLVIRTTLDRSRLPERTGRPRSHGASTAPLRAATGVKRVAACGGVRGRVGQNVSVVNIYDRKWIFLQLDCGKSLSLSGKPSSFGGSGVRRERQSHLCQKDVFIVDIERSKKVVVKNILLYVSHAHGRHDNLRPSEHLQVW